ncbi:MAG TPA: hypothetical protein VJX67_26335, partial [Blastocatellia bacterium]|nr:hypothetical protein [Blastocatellia bacterium]
MSTRVRQGFRFDLLALTPAVRPPRPKAAEVVAAAIAALAIGLVVFYYISAVKPAQLRLDAAEAALRSVRNTIVTGGVTGDPNTSSKEQIKLAVESLDDFEAQWLKPISEGRISLLDELNSLVRADNLRLTSGIEIQSPKKSSASSKTAPPTKVELNVFPTVRIHFVVGGQYSAIRKFIRDLSKTKQFLVIDSISIANGLEQKAVRGRPVPVAPESGL